MNQDKINSIIKAFDNSATALIEASKQIGNALSDPLRGLSALGRSIIPNHLNKKDRRYLLYLLHSRKTKTKLLASGKWFGKLPDPDINTAKVQKLIYDSLHS